MFQCRCCKDDLARDIHPSDVERGTASQSTVPSVQSAINVMRVRERARRTVDLVLTVGMVTRAAEVLPAEASGAPQLGQLTA